MHVELATIAGSNKHHQKKNTQRERFAEMIYKTPFYPLFKEHYTMTAAPSITQS